MTNTECKTLVFGEKLETMLVEVANPRNLIVIDKFSSSHSYDPSQPIVAIVDAFDSLDELKEVFADCIQSRENGYPTAIMGVLTWDTLRTAKDLQVTTAQLSVFDDLLLLPAKAFEFDLRFAKLEHTAKMRSSAVSTKFSFGPLQVDMQSMSVEVRGKYLRLTRKETELLLFMARNADEIVTKERIARAVWHIERPSSSFENVLTGHVSRLREKLGDVGCRGLLRTVRNVGLQLSLSQPIVESKL